MRTSELIERANIVKKDRHYFATMLVRPWTDHGWAGRYFPDCYGQGQGNYRNWNYRDLVVLRLIRDCMNDGIEDPIRLLLVQALREAPEGTNRIRVQYQRLSTFYSPDWSRRE